MTNRKNNRQAPKSINGQGTVITKYLDIEEMKEQEEHRKKHKVFISMSNVYVQTVLKLFNRYLIEEATGQGISADSRLDSLLKQARNLHRVERNAMLCNGHHFSNRDETNTELVFTD